MQNPKNRFPRLIIAAILFVIAVADSTALSVTAGNPDQSNGVATWMSSESASRAFSDIQVRRLRALLMANDVEDKEAVFDRLMRLQEQAGRASTLDSPRSMD